MNTKKLTASLYMLIWFWLGFTAHCGWQSCSEDSTAQQLFIYHPDTSNARTRKHARAQMDGVWRRERERELARLFMCFGVCNSIGHTVFIRETQKFGEVFFCLKLYISITSKPIGFEHLGKLHIGPVMVLGCFIFRNNSCNGLIYISIFFSVPFNVDPINAQGIAASIYNTK